MNDSFHVFFSWLLILFFLYVCRKECGLDRFVPASLAESMKRKELRKLLTHFIKLNANLTTAGQKQLTALQAKLHYLKIISDLPSYGAKCFSTNISVSWQIYRILFWRIHIWRKLKLIFGKKIYTWSQFLDNTNGFVISVFSFAILLFVGPQKK